jgi:spermidine/putrescine transport system substrate-binding protein
VRRPIGFDDRMSRRGFIGRAAATVAAASTLGELLDVSSAVAAAKPKVKPVADGDITWLTWAEYVPPKVVSAFEKEYKVKVTQTFMDNGEQVVQKLAAGVPYDVVTTDSEYFPQTAAGNLLQPFDPASLKNWDQLLPYYEKPWWESGQFRYSIPYGNGPDGIFYLKSKLHGKLSHTWDDLFTHPEMFGHLYLFSIMSDTLGMALLRRGHSCNSAVESQVVQAANDLVALKPHVAGFTTNVVPIGANGQAWMMMDWDAQVYQAIEQSKHPEDVGFYAPPGSMLACDCLAIGANAKSPGTALLFLDWILKPENNAAVGLFDLQSTGAKARDAAFRSQLKKYPFLSWSNDLLPDIKNWKIYPTGARLQLWNEQWTRITA